MCVGREHSLFLIHHFSCVIQETLLPSLSLPEEVMSENQHSHRAGAQSEVAQVTSLLTFLDNCCLLNATVGTALLGTKGQVWDHSSSL